MKDVEKQKQIFIFTPSSHVGLMQKFDFTAELATSVSWIFKKVQYII